MPENFAVQSDANFAEQRLISLRQLPAEDLASMVLDLEEHNDLLRRRLDASANISHVLSENIRFIEERDALTGIYGRLGLERAYDRLVMGGARSSDSPGPHSIIFADLDHFGSINKQHGHGAGDRLLVLTSQVLRANVREYKGDVVGRFAGDEFVLMLSQCTVEAAYSIAERIRLEIKELPQTLGLDVDLGLSAGVTEINPQLSFDTARDAADAVMSNAKKRGRGMILQVDLRG